MRAVNAPVPSRQVSVQLSLQVHYRQPKGQGVHSNAVAIPTAATQSTHVESLQKKKSHTYLLKWQRILQHKFLLSNIFPLGFPVHKAWSCYENQNMSQPFNLLNLKMQVTKVSYWVDNDILPFLRVKHPLNAISTFHSPLFQLVINQPFGPRKYNMWKQTIKTASLCLARIVSMVVIWCYWIPVKSSVDDMHFVCNYKTWKTKANCNPRFGPHIDSMVIEWCQWINVKANVDDMWL